MKITGSTVIWVFLAQMAFCVFATFGGCDDTMSSAPALSSFGFNESDEDYVYTSPEPRTHALRQEYVVRKGDTFENILGRQGVAPWTEEYSDNINKNVEQLAKRWNRRCARRPIPDRGYCSTPLDTLKPGDRLVLVWQVRVP